MPGRERRTKRFTVKIISLTGNPKSMLARASDACASVSPDSFIAVKTKVAEAEAAGSKLRAVGG